MQVHARRGLHPDLRRLPRFTTPSAIRTAATSFEPRCIPDRRLQPCRNPGHTAASLQRITRRTAPAHCATATGRRGFGKMLTINRNVDDITRSSNEEQSACKRGREKIDYHLSTSDKKKKTCDGSMISDDFDKDDIDQDVCYLLSKEVSFAQSIVLLLLIDGDDIVLTCSGIPIESKATDTRLLTSENLGRTFIAKRNLGHVMKIQVRDTSNNIARGWLEQHFVERGYTLVKVEEPLDVCIVNLHNGPEVLTGNDLVGMEFMDSGKPTAIKGIMTAESNASEDGIELSYSTCKVSKTGDGGPLFDGDGNFVGMNLFLGKKTGAFMRKCIIVEKLKQFEKEVELRARGMYRQFRTRRTRPYRTSYPKENERVNQDMVDKDLDSLGYPKPSVTAVDCGMVLVNTFEEPFGDSFDSGEGVWGILSERVSKDLSQSVVSLASYSGATRLFACSGMITELNGCATILTSASLIRSRRDENKIDESLRIDVVLPNNQHTEGTLNHYNFHYNVAIVSFKDFCASTTNIYDRGARKSSKVVAIGRGFESGLLMASGGMLTRWHRERRYDCGSVFFSSCEITKAGIGGPLIDFDGKFVGMNFYDENQGTPFLDQSAIVHVMEHFENKRVAAEADEDGYINRWPVPKPCWRRSDEHRRNGDIEDQLQSS